jgi:hypothetical protein
MEKKTREEYVRQQRRRVAELAQGIINHDVDTIEEREIARLRYEVDVDPNDVDFAAFVLAESETDHLPSGAEKANWNPESFKRKAADLARAREWAYEAVREESEHLIRRFGDA